MRTRLRILCFSFIMGGAWVVTAPGAKAQYPVPGPVRVYFADQLAEWAEHRRIPMVD